MQISTLSKPLWPRNTSSLSTKNWRLKIFAARVSKEKEEILEGASNPLKSSRSMQGFLRSLQYLSLICRQPLADTCACKPQPPRLERQHAIPDLGCYDSAAHHTSFVFNPVPHTSSTTLVPASSSPTIDRVLWIRYQFLLRRHPVEEPARGITM